MFSLTTNIIEEKSYMEDIIPVSRQLLGLLGVPASESQIIEIATNHTVVLSPLVCTIREIIQRLQQIHATETKTFYLDASKLADETIPLDFRRENSFFYNQRLLKECNYIIPRPLNENSPTSAIFGTISHWKQNPQLPHSAPIGVALLLNILLRFVITDQRYRYRLDELLKIWIYASPLTFIDETFYLASQISGGKV